MASLSMTGQGSADKIASILEEEVCNSAMSCELVDHIVRQSGNAAIHIMVFEKYYWRAGNRASLTAVVSGEDGRVAVDAIGSGGGQGPVFKFSWGAEEDFVGAVERCLGRLGFR